MEISQYPNLLEHIAQKLQEPLPSKEALAMMFPHIKAMPDKVPDDARLSAVMMLLYIKNNEWHILAIQRTEDGHAHSGQVSFPGGRHEPEDVDLLNTAVRETFEEIGVQPHQIKIIGALSSVYIVVSNFNVFPYIGYIEQLDEWKLSENEVKSVLEIPLGTLLSPKAKVKTEVITPIQPNVKRVVNAYQLPDNTIIWGATAIMIAELELLLR